jgi:outer membrane protein assembly factor BamD (BamD/ComL family)
LFDTPGRAIQALNSVHIHDPSGKWADSALMTRATYHLRKKNYRDADIDFNTIRRDYPKSKFAEAAFILGAHASLMSYQGAQYDGKQLDEAKKLTEAAIRLYPDSPQRPKLESDLKKIGAEAGDRAWVRVEFHLKRGEKNSAAVYCENIIEKFPESPRAAQAREVLISLGAEHAAGILKTPLFEKEPARPKPQEAPYDEPEEPGRLRISDDDGEPISEAK